MAPPLDVILPRLTAAQNGLASHGLDVLVVSSPVHLYYLFGFRASAGMAIVDPGGAWIVADARYARQADAVAATTPGIGVRHVPTGSSYEETVAHALADLGAGRAGLEADHLTVGRAATLRRVAGPGVDWVETSGLVERLRMVKDAWEIGRLREAGARLAEVAACILPKVSSGCTERQVAWEAQLALNAAGFEKPAFDTIVASGPNGAFPHHRAGDRRITDGDLVVVDFGGVLDGYAVDMTRTVAVGAVAAEPRRWLRAVAAAQAAAIAAARPGVLPSAVDAAARASLAAHGLAERFVHSTGHGLGLDVHERPTIGPRGDVDGPIRPGLVFTVEPGVYVPGEGGVRIEDDVVVTDAGVERLTGAPPAFEAHDF